MRKLALASVNRAEGNPAAAAQAVLRAHQAWAQAGLELRGVGATAAAFAASAASLASHLQAAGDDGRRLLLPATTTQHPTFAPPPQSSLPLFLSLILSLIPALTRLRFTVVSGGRSRASGYPPSDARPVEGSERRGRL
jgi:hypothetical protein